MSMYIEPPKSEDLQWNSGFPPDVGWYPASYKSQPDPTVLRYHFGDGVWSNGFGHEVGASFFDLYGDVKPVDPQPVGILWAEPWWNASSAEPVRDETQIDLFSATGGPGDEVG